MAAQFKSNPVVASAAGKSPVTKTFGNDRYIGLIFLALPNARVISLERHTLDTIYSCYQQNFTSGNDFSFNLEWAAECYKVYQTFMGYWRQTFPERILTVHYENPVWEK